MTDPKNEVDEKVVEEAVIDQVQRVFERAKEELKKVMCSVHGEALKELEFDRTQGRFKIDTCCSEGESKVNEAIASLN